MFWDWECRTNGVPNEQTMVGLDEDLIKKYTAIEYSPAGSISWTGPSISTWKSTGSQIFKLDLISKIKNNEKFKLGISLSFYFFETIQDLWNKNFDIKYDNTSRQLFK